MASSGLNNNLNQKGRKIDGIYLKHANAFEAPHWLKLYLRITGQVKDWKRLTSKFARQNVVILLPQLLLTLTNESITQRGHLRQRK